MCLSLMGGSLGVPPSERASRLGSFLKITAMALVGLCIISITSSFIDAIYGLLCAGLAYFTVKDANNYKVQQLMCVVFLSGYLAFISISAVCLYFGGVYSTNEDGPFAKKNEGTFIYWTAVVGVILSPILYITCCYLARELYNELRGIVNNSWAGAMGGAGGNGGGAARIPVRNQQGGGGNSRGGGHASGFASGGLPAPGNVPPPSGAGLYDEEQAPQRSQGDGRGGKGFKAFSGKGHRLG